MKKETKIFMHVVKKQFANMTPSQAFEVMLDLIMDDKVQDIIIPKIENKQADKDLNCPFCGSPPLRKPYSDWVMCSNNRCFMSSKWSPYIDWNSRGKNQVSTIWFVKSMDKNGYNYLHDEQLNLKGQYEYVAFFPNKDEAIYSILNNSDIYSECGIYPYTVVYPLDIASQYPNCSDLTQESWFQLIDKQFKRIPTKERQIIFNL